MTDHWAGRGYQRSLFTHRIFFIFDFCDEIAQLDTFLVSLPAAQTPTWVGLGGEDADTNGFWDPFLEPEIQAEC